MPPEDEREHTSERSLMTDFVPQMVDRANNIVITRGRPDITAGTAITLWTGASHQWKWGMNNVLT